MNLSEIEVSFMKELYTYQFEGRRAFDWREWGEAKGFERGSVDRAYEELRDAGLVKARSIGPFGQLTSRGVLFAEKNNLAPEQLAEANDEYRVRLLKALYAIRLENGPRADEDWQRLCSWNNLSEQLYHANAAFMRDCGLVENVTVHRIKIGVAGITAIISIEAKEALSRKLAELNEGGLSPQQRGTELEKLMEDVVRDAKWEVDRNVRRQGEETDLIISRELNYFVISCKWEKKPVQTGAVRDLRDRITHRPGTRGIFLSMSGFAKGAHSLAEERLESAVILLFGPKDIDQAVDGKFDDLLKSKLRDAMTVRKMTWE